MIQKSFILEQRDEALLAALSSARGKAIGRRPGEATVPLEAGVAKARWTEDWLTLRVATEPVRDGRPTLDRLQNVLHLNALAAGVRYVYTAGDQRMHASAELPIGDVPRDEFDTVHRWVASARAALSAARRFETARIAAEPAPRIDSRAAPPALRARLDETRWPGVAGEDDRCRADLALHSGHAQAELVADGDVVRIGVDLGDDDLDPEQECAFAASLCLLQSASRARLVAAVADLREAHFAPRLEVVLPADAGPAWLRHALCALSVVYDTAADEVLALAADRDLAATFVQFHTPPAEDREVVPA